MEGAAALAVAGAVGMYAIRRRAQGKRPHGLEWVREPGFSVDRRAAFRVVTYNVLAPSSRFGLSEKYDSYCPRRYREWSYRFPRILEQLDALDGDIVGIQARSAAAAPRAGPARFCARIIPLRAP